jgi:hypothetical protein
LRLTIWLLLHSYLSRRNVAWRIATSKDYSGRLYPLKYYLSVTGTGRSLERARGRCRAWLGPVNWLKNSAFCALPPPFQSFAASLAFWGTRSARPGNIRGKPDRPAGPWEHLPAANLRYDVALNCQKFAHRRDRSGPAGPPETRSNRARRPASGNILMGQLQCQGKPDTHYHHSFYLGWYPNLGEPVAMPSRPGAGVQGVASVVLKGRYALNLTPSRRERGLAALPLMVMSGQG